MLASEEPREGKAPTRDSGVGAESAVAPPTETWTALTPIWIADPPSFLAYPLSSLALPRLMAIVP